jgi:RNase P protein component
MFEVVVILSSVLIILALLEWFFDETRVGRSISTKFSKAMRRNSKNPGPDKDNEAE